MTQQWQLESIGPQYQRRDPVSEYIHYDLEEIGGGRITLVAEPFSQYAGDPLYEHLCDWVKPHHTVIGIESFYPYGVNPGPDEVGKGLAGRVMSEIIMPEGHRYDARMLHCETEKEGMQRFLRNQGFGSLGPADLSAQFYRLL